MSWVTRGVLACLMWLVVPRAAAQSPPSATRFGGALPTLRADLIIDRDVSAQLAGGLAIPAAYNVRLAVDAGVGAASRASNSRTVGRIDATARWLSDPFRRSVWGLYASGGLGLRVEQHAAAVPVAIVALGIEHAGTGAWLRGVEVGLGGGVRIGVTLRRARPNRR